MDSLQNFLILLAVILLILEAIGITSKRVSSGWLGLAILSVAVFLLPTF